MFAQNFMSKLKYAHAIIQPKMISDTQKKVAPEKRIIKRNDKVGFIISENPQKNLTSKGNGHNCIFF